MGALAAAVCAILLVGGALAVAAGWRDQGRPRERRQRRPWTESAWVRRFGPGRIARAAAWLAIGAGAAAMTGWPLLAVLCPALGIAVPYLLGKPVDHELELLQALDRWVRTLAAILPTGRSIGDAIRVSTRQAPDLLAEPLTLLVQRMDDRWTLPAALHAMADELDSADADAVLAALSLAAERGGTGAQATLTALADAIQDRLRALREIETERAKPRLVVRQVTVITLVVLGGALVFGGSFFEPYRTPLGQVILVVLVAGYLGSLLALRRMALPRPRQRILGRATR